MFGYDNIRMVPVQLGDPGASRNILAFRAPCDCEVISAYAVDNIGIVAGTANYFTVALQNGGSGGTATTALATAIGGTAVGGTAPAWVVNVPQAFTVTKGTLTAGDWVRVAYVEVGTLAQNVGIVLNVVNGIGA